MALNKGSGGKTFVSSGAAPESEPGQMNAAHSWLRATIDLPRLILFLSRNMEQQPGAENSGLAQSIPSVAMGGIRPSHLHNLSVACLQLHRSGERAQYRTPSENELHRLLRAHHREGYHHFQIHRLGNGRREC